MGSPLEHASQRVDKVTHVALPAIPASTPGGAIAKANYVTSLVLQVGDVDGVLTTHDRPNAASSVPSAGFSTSLADVLRLYEGSPLPSSLPAPSVFATVPVADLLAFGTALQSRRSDILAQATDLDADSTGALVGLLNSVANANKNLQSTGAVTPVGMLNLERLEMTPAGIVRGDLLATIPLAPGETTSVYQKEWSVTSSEFTSIVTDSLDNYSETGVTENTNLAQSTTSQNTHNNQYNVTASASGGCGFVSGSVSASGGVSQAATQSATQSRNDAIKTTRQASTRTKQEHKMSISTTTVTGSGESSTRTITNPSANAIRIDYFSLIEEWRVRLYRYGLRLTYDLTIPEPGSTLREQYAQLDELNHQASQTFVFPYKQSDITDTNYQDLAAKFGASGFPGAYPKVGTPFDVPGNFPANPPSDGLTLPMTVSVDDPNYCITKVTCTAFGHFTSDNQKYLEVAGAGPPLIADGSSLGLWDQSNNYFDVPSFELQAGGAPFLANSTGSQQVSVFSQYIGPAVLTLHVETALTSTAYANWQATVWQALYNAAQSQFYADQQVVNAKITALQSRLNGVDTLTLRREENDEIMKGILRFLLSTWFDFMPNNVLEALQVAASIAVGGSHYEVNDVLAVTGGGGTGMRLLVTKTGTGGSVSAFQIQDYGSGYSTTSGASTTGGHGAGAKISLTIVSMAEIEHGEAFAKALLRLSGAALTTLANYGQTVLFINEAIEWENLIFYLDSYFWDIPASWNFIRQIQHPDAQRQAFLRAGSARVVVPIRKGYELAWSQFYQGGSVTPSLSADSPYMTIAQEIQDYDNTNYPGIPPANPADQSSTATTTTSSATVGPSTTAIAIPVASSAGFIVGQPATVDTGSLAETATVTALATGSITVVSLASKHDGSTTAFPITQDNTSQSDSTMAATICTATLSSSLLPVSIAVQSSAGFIAGYTALVDSGQNAECQLIVSVGDGTITVQRLVNAHDGSTTAFPVAQQNEAGVLIAEWNEYTPTSGTDIAVTSNLATIS